MSFSSLMKKAFGLFENYALPLLLLSLPLILLLGKPKLNSRALKEAFSPLQDWAGLSIVANSITLVALLLIIFLTIFYLNCSLIYLDAFYEEHIDSPLKYIRRALKKFFPALGVYALLYFPILCLQLWAKPFLKNLFPSADPQTGFSIYFALYGLALLCHSILEYLFYFALPLIIIKNKSWGNALIQSISLVRKNLNLKTYYQLFGCFVLVQIGVKLLCFISGSLAIVIDAFSLMLWLAVKVGLYHDIFAEQRNSKA